MKSSSSIHGLAILALTSLPWLAGCGGQSQENPAAPPAAAILPGTLFAAVADQPISIVEARQNAVDGERVVLRGMVGGRLAPFVEGRAIMLLVDESLPLCQGCCDTPWDMCCERPDIIAAHSATIQVVDTAGQPLRTSLRGQAGLAPLVRVAVEGTVKRQGEAVFLVNADRLAIQPAGSASPPCGSACGSH